MAHLYLLVDPVIEVKNEKIDEEFDVVVVVVRFWEVSKSRRRSVSRRTPRTLRRFAAENPPKAADLES